MQNNIEENPAQETSRQEMDMEENNVEENNNAAFITAFPQDGILDGGVTSSAVIAQQLAEHGFHWPVPASAVWTSSQELPMNLMGNISLYCPNINQVREQDGATKLCDVMGFVTLPAAFGPAKTLAAVLLRIKQLVLLENNVQKPVDTNTCFQNHHEIYLGRINNKGHLEWHRLASLGMLKLDLDKMSIVKRIFVDNKPRLSFTPLPDLLIAECGLSPDKHTATAINKLIGHDTSPLEPQPAGCLNIWHKPASPRKKKDKRDQSPQREATAKSSKKINLKKIKNKKSQAKETLKACEDTYQLAKKLRHEAMEKRSQAQTEVNKYRQLILDYYASTK